MHIVHKGKGVTKHTHIQTHSITVTLVMQKSDRRFIMFITSKPTRIFMRASISRPMLDIKTPFAASSCSHSSCHLILSFWSWKQICILSRLCSLLICRRAQPTPADWCLALHTTRYLPIYSLFHSRALQWQQKEPSQNFYTKLPLIMLSYTSRILKATARWGSVYRI